MIAAVDCSGLEVLMSPAFKNRTFVAFSPNKYFDSQFAVEGIDGPLYKNEGWLPQVQ